MIKDKFLLSNDMFGGDANIMLFLSSALNELEGDLYVLLDVHAEITSHSELESRTQVEATGFAWSWHQYCAGVVLFSTNEASPNRPALHPPISQSGNQIYGSIFVVLFLQDSQHKLATFYSFILVSWLTSQMMESCD